jgi:hypothetical protein
VSGSNGKVNGLPAPLVPRREGVAVGRIVECRFRMPGSRDGRTKVGMAVVKEVHPEKLIVKVFTGTINGRDDPVVEIDRLRGEWRLLYGR